MQEMTTNIEWHVAKNLWKFQVLRPGMIICVIIYPILLSLNCYGYVVVESVCEHPTVDRNRELCLFVQLLYALIATGLLICYAHKLIYYGCAQF